MGTRLRRAVRDWIYIPDGQAAWIPFAVAAAERALRTAPEPRVLLSTSVPYSAHLAARIVARRKGVPWVAEFRDPWALVADALRARSRGRKAIDTALERRVIDAASALVVTSESTRDAMTAAYDDLSPNRVWVIRNGFGEVSGPVAPPAPDAPLLLLQAGSVPPEVSLEPLLRGIAEVARSDPDSVRLRVLAPPGRWEAAASAVGWPPWLELDGLVSPSAARHAMASASANVLLRPGEEHHEYVAAKLIEYLGARRPILGIVAGTGEMARLGVDYGDMRLLPHYDAAAVSSMVADLLRVHRSGALQRAVDPRRPLEELTRRSQAGRLASCLRTLPLSG